MLLTLLIDHGLRVGEVVALQLEDIEGLEGAESIDDDRKVLQEQVGPDEATGLVERKQYILNARPTDELGGPGKSAGQAHLRRTCPA